MNKQVKAALSAVRGLISGHPEEPNVAAGLDKEGRKAVAKELLGVMCQPELPATGSDPETLVREKERSRQLFMELGYFDEAVEDLRAGASAQDRAAAARALGIVGNPRATVDLVAAMFDDDEEVRNAAGEALNQIGDPSVSAVPPPELNVNQSATAPESFEGLPLMDGDTVESHPSEDSKLAADMAEATSVASEEQATELVSEDLSQTSVGEVERPAETENTVDAEEQLLLEEHAVREKIDEYERQLMAHAASRLKAENEARWRAEREAKIAKDAEARRVEEEQQRQRTEEESARRRSGEVEALAMELSARQQSEAEVHRLMAEESHLRIEAGNLRLTAEELARQRRQLEATRREESEAARLAQATRARQEAEKRHQDELERLHGEEQAFRFATEEIVRRRSELEATRRDTEEEISALVGERNRLLEVAQVEIKQFKEELEQLLAAEALTRSEAERQIRESEERKKVEEEELQRQTEALNTATANLSARRAEVEAARKKAEQDSERLAESLKRMQAAEEKRVLAERERVQVEATTNERVASEERLLDEARRRAIAEQARLDEEKRRHDEGEERRMAALEEVHRQTLIEAQQRADKEKQLLTEIDHLRIEDAEARRRIEEAETLKRTSEQAYRVVAEKLQRTEAEAHAASQEESQTLTKLEAVRRDLANQAQARAAQEKRIKDEIEQFHRLQDEERPRIEAAILQRTAAAARLQQMRDSRPEVPPNELQRYQVAGATSNNATAGTEPPLVQPVAKDEGLRLVSARNDEAGYDLPASTETSAGQVQPAVDAYLTSVDPYKRAAGVAELARTGGAAAFAEIAKCFDDHSSQVRYAAARALSKLEPARTVDFFNRAIEQGTDERRRNIGSAIAGSGMASEAIDNLAGESREHTYNALSILFVMAKTGEVQSLVKAIEEHSNDEVRQAVVKLLTLSGHKEMAEAALKRREQR
ncbi:MAG TPA: HEAT repeat domain-containing protein [Pyrinomonadaceae bacterium]|nr:HEAT repeat domain-containing protein [Pyrinomonadaceae bacterium]